MNIYGEPSCTYNAFVEHLRHSPAFSEAHTIWAALFERRVDPAVALGFFHHESNCGNAGRAVQTKSWGNIRWRAVYSNLNYPVRDIDGFAAYPSYTLGAIHFADHLLGRDFTNSYTGLTTVEQVVPIWAPSADGNSPPDYINAVIRLAAGLIMGVAMKKVLLVAGHVNIENLTSDRIGQESADILHNKTGSHGERDWTGWFVGQLRDALKATGLVDARATDCTYNAELYQTWNPDVIIHSHFHRDRSEERAIFSAPELAVFMGRVDVFESERLRDRFVGGYERVTGIPVTQNFENVNTRQYYGYWFSEPHSAAILAEWGNANVDTATLYTPALSIKIITFARDCILEHLNLSGAVEPPPQRRESDVPPIPSAPTPKSLADAMRSLAAQVENLKVV
ncbi:MAG TPA: hypothetical protein VFK94_06470 [Patescibacteria group bacterium]|nr:hypothetical protein [Patescibacteria group bacterium]